jgi:NADH:ubiquinone oxidoreductase subunit F (NADH-binding)
VVPNVGGISLCALGDAAQGPVKSLIEKFGDEIRDNLRNRRYPLPLVPFFDLGAVA